MIHYKRYQYFYIIEIQKHLRFDHIVSCTFWSNSKYSWYMILIKIIRFAGFLRVQIHSWNVNVSWTLQSTSLRWGVAWYWAAPSSRSFYIILLIGIVGGEGEENCKWVGGERGEENQSLITKRIFHIYLYSHYLYLDC